MGADFGSGNLEQENWNPRLKSFRNVLNSWRQRSLSFQGKALIANALALSGLWYVASILPVPDWVIKEINTVLFDFFWSGKKDLVARNVVVQPRSSGGFGIVDVSQM